MTDNERRMPDAGGGNVGNGKYRGFLNPTTDSLSDNQ